MAPAGCYLAAAGTRSVLGGSQAYIRISRLHRRSYHPRALGDNRAAVHCDYLAPGDNRFAAGHGRDVVGGCRGVVGGCRASISNSRLHRRGGYPLAMDDISGCGRYSFSGGRDSFHSGYLSGFDVL